MSIIFAIIFLTAYLATGVQVARMRYSLDYRKYDAVKGGQDDNFNKLNNKKLALDKMDHSSWCYLQYDIIADKGCSCGNKKKWLELRNDIKKIKAEGFVSPAEVSYSTLGLWPLWFLSQYIQKLKPEHQIVKGEVIESEDEPVSEWRSKIESDPMYIALTSEWEKIEAQLEKDKAAGMLEPKKKDSGRTAEDYDRYYRKVNRKIDNYISYNKGYK